MEPKNRIFVAGHRGMVGSAIVRGLQRRGCENLILRDSSELNLADQQKVKDFFNETKPEVVVLAAAKVGGIEANRSNPAAFLYDNLMIQSNVIEAAARSECKKLVFLGSSCVYPRLSPQPMKEDYLLDGKLEPTNEGYALAKIAGLRLSQYFGRQFGFKTLNVMPCNLYGPNDTFDLNKSHVVPALVRRFVDAADQNLECVTLWGTGSAMRELMHVDDLAEAIFYLDSYYASDEIINIGTGEDIKICDLAEMVAGVVGYRGKINWDISKPDGMPRKCLDVTRLASTGFVPSVQLKTGLLEVVNEYRSWKG